MTRFGGPRRCAGSSGSSRSAASRTRRRRWTGRRADRQRLTSSPATATRGQSIRTTAPIAHRPVPFLPANAKASGLIYVDGVLYTTTSNGCGATPNGVWAIDLTSETKKPVSWKTNGGNVAGAAGLAFGPDGTIFAAIGDGASGSGAYANAVVALEPKTLKLKEAFTQPGADFNTSPVVFRHKDKDLMAVSGNDGRLYLLDATSLKTPLYVTPKYSNPGATGGLATWESEGTRWILAPAIGAPPAGTKLASNGVVTNGASLPSNSWTTVASCRSSRRGRRAI